jgi:hypothetical protein
MAQHARYDRTNNNLTRIIWLRSDLNAIRPQIDFGEVIVYVLWLAEQVTLQSEIRQELFAWKI